MQTAPSTKPDSPKQDVVDEPYQSVLNHTFDLLAQLETLDGWQLVKEDAEFGVKISRLAYEGKDYMRGDAFLDCSLMEFADFIQQWHRRKEWDNLLDQQTMVKQLSEYTYLLHLIFAAPWPVTSRDVAVVASRRELGDDRDTVILCGASIDDPLIPVDSAKVRAETQTGYIVRPKTDRNSPGLSITCFVYVDYKGWLPTWLANQVGVEAPLVVGRIGKVMQADKNKK
eukprot:TRINITY_DN672_c0_g1_i1.p1 TRINITY_DN672_c0_g1~~TRINITY_DN672_c0_g1_i1.p1  ORF type:complete len:227 (+),score=32.37 TRINITY_DN672_c0_g1_i1:46-726(+)